MSSGMYPQAIELLNKSINEKPADAEAHFQLGVCFVNTGNFRGADERFASAVKLKSDYGFQIGGKYKKAGLEQLDKDNINGVKRLFSKAIQYQPNLKDGICQELLTKAQQDVGLIDNCLAICKNFQCNTDKEFAKIYFTASHDDSCKNPLEYLRNASSLDSQYKIQTAKELVKVAETTNDSVKKLTLLSEATSISNEYRPLLKDYFQKLKKEKKVKEMRTLVSKYGQSLSTKDQEFLAPPPVWQEVPGSRIMVTGKGFGSNDQGKLRIKIVGLKKGDKFIVQASRFDVKKTVNGKSQWVSYTVKEEFHCTWNPSGYPTPFRAPKGEKLIVYLKRLI